MPEYRVQVIARFKAEAIVEAEDEDDAKAEAEILGESEIEVGELEEVEVISAELYDDGFSSLTPEQIQEILARHPPKTESE